MSNKETLQQHNARLSENSTDLGSILETINKLPTVEEVKLQEKSVTPTTEEQNITADEGYTGLGAVTVAGDENLVAENIKKDIEIFGVVGSAESGNAEMVLSNTSSTPTIGKYLKKIPLVDTSNLTTFSKMFENCNSLEEIPLLDTSNVTTFFYAFNECRSLKKIPLFNTSNAKNMPYAFYGCTNLEEVPLLDTSNVTNMQSAFSGCGSLKIIPQFNTSNVTDFNRIFYSGFMQSKIETIPELNAEKATNIENMFYGCVELVDFGGLKNVGKGFTSQSSNKSAYIFYLNHSTKLTHESLMNVINNLYDLNLTYDVANGGTLYTQKLTLGSDNLAKLTAEEIAIATNKGWTVS